MGGGWAGYRGIGEDPRVGAVQGRDEEERGAGLGEGQGNEVLQV